MHCQNCKWLIKVKSVGKSRNRIKISKHNVHKERCQSQLSFDKVQHRQFNQLRQCHEQILIGPVQDPPVKSGAWENVRNGYCLATVAPNRQLDKALWSNLETRSQRILYIRTLLYIGSPLIPTAIYPSHWRHP